MTPNHIRMSILRLMNSYIQLQTLRVGLVFPTSRRIYLVLEMPCPACNGFHLPTSTCKELYTFRSSRDSGNSLHLSQVQALRSAPLPLMRPYALQNRIKLQLPASFSTGRHPRPPRAFLLAPPALPDVVREPL